MKHNFIRDIKDFLCLNYSIDIVLIQIGGWFEVIEECADIMNREFGLKIHDNAGLRSYRVLRFPLRSQEKYESLIRNKNYSYSFVMETQREECFVIRKIENTNNKKSRDLIFEHLLKNKKKKNLDQPTFQNKDNDKLKEYLDALINGFNPFNGVFFEEDSVWKSKEVLNMLKKISSKKNNLLDKQKETGKVKIIEDDNDSGMKDGEYFFNGEFFENQSEWREKIKKSKNLFHAYEPWTDDLDQELQELKSQLSIEELAKHFRRTKGAIKSRLKKINLEK